MLSFGPQWDRENRPSGGYLWPSAARRAVTLTLSTSDGPRLVMRCAPKWATSSQNPDHQIYLPTVREELTAGMAHPGESARQWEQRVADVAALFGLPDIG